ncbi:helix-turn-helix domain-containing protein [Noviherbaspirillum sp. CPCC 100848]|uniref:Helix-turn-helix domain-containing protein n=1 Tax=Noviherbaspirillum album TaxID=3080276 RepID=A0ABU6JE71_9BURK|nr:helix-turn-helix domain-containing protein [Noviherbaspirillum sp. CPCC 100848]MEC4721957.1 helix-turn-helix domain-containing protein [Noviherbaspirillum sp. CPCC 100848]
MPTPTSLPSPDDPEAALAAVVALRRMADKLERAAVANAIRQGWSWTQVADALGVSKQAAHKRLSGTLQSTDLSE